MSDVADPVGDFLRAACVPRDAGHTSGTLARAAEILAGHPELTDASIHAAAALGDDVAVRRLLAADPAAAGVKGGPYGWDALTHLCFSRYLRLDSSRSEAFVRAAEALLDAGADPNTGWLEEGHQPRPEWESAIYGAAGVAHNPELTRLLLERGADPNDGETPYHTPESYDNRAMAVLVESGRLSADSLATMLLRKTDWHDLEGIRLLLENGVDPNRMTRWGKTALHNALLRDNSLEIIELLLDHGADPTLAAPRLERSSAPSPARTAVQIAARRGRGDALARFERRGFPTEPQGMEALLAACARGDAATARAIADANADAVEALRGAGGTALARFAGVGNSDGVRLLLELGVPVTAVDPDGEGYFDVAPGSCALHVAAWRARHDTVRLLLDRGAPVNAKDGSGRRPLQLAVRACVDSYWVERRAPESVEALLLAGASVEGVPFPSGYAAVDDLLRRHGAAPSGAAAPPSPRE